jgi:hypothetical protein
MSEVNFEQQSNQVYRRFHPLLDLDEYDDNELEATDVVTVDDSYGVISMDDMETNKKHDAVITTFYKNAADSISEINQFTDELHRGITKKVEAEITAAEKMREDRIEEINAIVDAKIAVLEHYRRMATEQERLEQAGNIAKSKQKQKTADRAVKSNLEDIKKVQFAIENGQSLQSRLEQDRDKTINEFNELVTQKQQREIDLEAAENKLGEFINKLALKGDDKDELEEIESTLIAKARIERDEQSKDKINAFLIKQNFSPNAPTNELPEVIVKTIKGFKAEVDTITLRGILGELEDNNRQQLHNKKSIKYLSDIINEMEHEISTLEAEIEGLTLEITQRNAKLNGKLKFVATEVQRHSTESVRVSTIFDGMIKGDTTEMALEALPSQLEQVHNNTLALKKVLASDSPVKENRELPVLTVNTLDILSDDLLEDELPDTTTLEKDQALYENIEQGGDNLLALKTLGRKGILSARTFFNPGVRVQVRDKKSKNS